MSLYRVHQALRPACPHLGEKGYHYHQNQGRTPRDSSAPDYFTIVLADEGTEGELGTKQKLTPCMGRM